ncbi:DUF397 domain-containing protein [Streptomyces sp. NPDC088789]|uniref:DUF397 domain-containing protein n=1 Tax=Streptomyces sp. NPDC088789 TaxID=3365899 RepID=UPI0037FDF8D7
MSAAELHWFKSSFSDDGDIQSCVEVAIASATIHVRDSKVPDAPHFAVARAAWADFVSYAVSDG